MAEFQYKPKPIIQYTLWEVELRRWPSAKEAARELGINYSKILACTNGQKRQYQGFLWRKAGEPIEKKVTSVF